ncbi:hypothetical protein EJ08DRAFT_652093 [Tothia fuscella]|uniref:Uncharacterized protein n=1 Tax=Tothia fuscella TaxID=1048955 RepID=A0A9P4NKC5_9PEZI|nr:hypothetical protein EJ08DRAFT_652093 [Tothia fuscella]
MHFQRTLFTLLITIMALMSFTSACVVQVPTRQVFVWGNCLAVCPPTASITTTTITHLACPLGSQSIWEGEDLGGKIWAWIRGVGDRVVEDVSATIACAWFVQLLWPIWFPIWFLNFIAAAANWLI